MMVDDNGTDWIPKNDQGNKTLNFCTQCIFALSTLHVIPLYNVNILRVTVSYQEFFYRGRGGIFWKSSRKLNQERKMIKRQCHIKNKKASMQICQLLKDVIPRLKKCIFTVQKRPLLSAYIILLRSVFF